MRGLAFLVVGLLVASCGNDEVSSQEEARRAYFGLDRSVDKALNLGMQGFNAASSANIPPQSGSGDVGGTLVVSGQVDQGSSNNKEMRLKTAFTGYQDRLPGGDAGAGAASAIVYDSDAAALPELDLSLKGIPTGTFTGSLIGKLHMTGDLEGDVTLTLAFAGNLASVSGGSGIMRAPGTTHITGSAASKYGTYTVDITR